jgi:hypothetical protein
MVVVDQESAFGGTVFDNTQVCANLFHAVGVDDRKNGLAGKSLKVVNGLHQIGDGTLE